MSLEQRDDGKLWCTGCKVVVVDTPKGIKQHVKSKPHKRLLDSEPGSPRRALDASADETQLELAALLGAQSVDELAATARAQLPAYAAALDAFRALDVGRDARAALFPPVFHNPRRECPLLDVPFVTPAVGSLPVVPTCLDEALRAFFVARRDRHPNVDIAESTVCVDSWADARRAVEAADAAGTRFWCTLFCPRMGHPSWWPKGAKGPGGVGEGPASVPFFDQVILGRGRTGIGVHADSHGAVRTPVSTCLTLARGRKRVIVLPPSTGDGKVTCSWFADEPFPLEPSAALLARIASVGGYCFELTVADETQEIALFTPAGWFHWLLGDVSHASGCAASSSGRGADCGSCDALCTDWHVVFGGSFFGRSAAPSPVPIAAATSDARPRSIDEESVGCTARDEVRCSKDEQIAVSTTIRSAVEDSASHLGRSCAVSV